MSLANDCTGERLAAIAQVEEVLRELRMVLDVSLSYDDPPRVGVETLMFDLPDGRTVSVEPRDIPGEGLVLVIVDPDTGQIVGLDGIAEGLMP